MENYEIIGGMMDLNDIKELMKILKKEEMAEIKVRYGKVKLTLKNAEAVSNKAETTSVTKVEQKTPEVPTINEEVVKSQNVGEIKLVKTEKNIEVSKGMVLAKINTIGLETDIKSPVNGILKEILVVDNSPVDYGKPLFVIEIK